MKGVVKFSSILLLPIALSGCGQFGNQFTCGDEDSKSTTLEIIKDHMEKAVGERSKDESGNALASSSAISAALSQLKMTIENIRTTKKDPDSTMQFCSGTLKVVYPLNVLKDADETRSMANLNNIDNLASKSDIKRKADAFEADLEYSVQPTDDGKKVFAQIDNFDDKLNVLAEITASYLLKSSWERMKRQKVQDYVPPADTSGQEEYFSNESENAF